MIKLEFENVDELITHYLDKLRNLRPDSKLFRDNKDFDLFVEAQMEEFKFYLKIIEMKRALKQKFEKLKAKLLEKSEEIKFDYLLKQEKFSNKQQKKMNKKLLKIFKDKCKLASKQGIDYEQKFYDEMNADFKAKIKADKQEKQEEKEQENKDAKQAKQYKKNAKANAKQGIVIEPTKVEAAEDKPLLEHKEDKK